MIRTATLLLTARAMSSSLVDWATEIEAEAKENAIAGTPVKRRRKRARKTERKTVPLTHQQTEAAQLVGEHEGNFTKSGAAAGKSRQAIAKLYRKAMKKLGKTATPKPRTKSLPVDHRGQADVADPEAVDLNRDPNAG